MRHTSARSSYPDEAMEFLLVFLLILYLAPWVLAESIEHRRANTILALNLGLG